MDATSIIDEWKRRLIKIAENPSYVFRETPQNLIERYQKKLTTFMGYSDSEINGVEEKLVIKFPVIFRCFLREMAKSHGSLFRGSDLVSISRFEEFINNANELMTETDPNLSLSKKAVVFCFHQGYTFLYFLAENGFDGPVMQYTEGKEKPQQITSTFSELINSELDLIERNNEKTRELGGYYLTLFPDGGASEHHPALSSGDRPLDKVKAIERKSNSALIKKWWHFWK